MAKGKGGFIGQDGLNAPDAPTGVSGTAGDTQVTVSFTAPSDVGGSAITGYNVQASDGTGIPNTVPASIPSSSYANVNFSVATQDTSPTGLTFKSDGTIMYVSGDTGNVIEEYALSSAWNVSTASHTSSYDVSSQTTDLEDVTFKTDGTKMYVLGGGTNDTVYQYSLSSAWDSSGASYESKSFALNSQDTSPTGLTFKSDGTKMYVTGNDGDTLEEYTLSSAWDVSTASASHSLDISGEETSPEDVEISSDGKYIYVAGGQQDGIDVYELSTAYDLSTASYVRTADVSGTGTTLSSCFVNVSTGQFWSLDKDARTVSEYTIGAFSYPTASPVTITGLTNGTSYTFNVWAINAFGWSSPSDASGSVTPANPITSTMAWLVGRVTPIDAYNIASTGNAIDYGDMTQNESNLAASSNTTQALISGFGFSNNATIDKLDLTSLGNTASFGSLTKNSQQASGVSNSTRAVHSIGYTNGAAASNSIEYMTFGTSGNSTDFGDLTSTFNLGCGSGSSTRGLFGGVAFNSKSNVINYITIASAGNATDFGDLTVARNGLAACSSTTRSIQFGGDTTSDSYSNIIDYVTIASTGNAIDFGDLSVGARYLGGSGSTTRGTIAGGDTSSGDTNRIEYVTIASTGNGTDFGDLTEARKSCSGFSNCHGGLS